MKQLLLLWALSITLVGSARGDFSNIEVQRTYAVQAECQWTHRISGVLFHDSVDETGAFDENDGDVDFYYIARPGNTTPMGYGRIKDDLSFIGGGVRLEWDNIWAGAILNAFPEPGDFSSGAAQLEAEIRVTLDRKAGVFYRSTTGSGTFSGGNPSHNQLILGPGTYIAREQIEVSAPPEGQQQGSEHISESVEIGTQELHRRLVLATHGWKPLVTSELSWIARMLSRCPPCPPQPSGSSVDRFYDIVTNIRDRAMWAYWFDNPNRPLDRQATSVEIWTPSSGASQPATVAWDQWDFAVVDWESDATSLSPWPAAQRARAIGTQIGLDLVNAPESYDQILLIGHSAGSWLIDAIADVFYQYSPDTYISMSFLDAYVPGIRHHDSSYAMGQLAEHADFADHYVNIGCDATDPYTNAILPFAFNIDVTADDAVYGCPNHGWPVDWYKLESEKHSADYKLGWWDSWIMKPGYSWRDDPSAVHSIYVNEWQRDVEFAQGKGVLLPNGDPIIDLPDLPMPGGPTQNFTPFNQQVSDANNVVIGSVAEGDIITMYVENPDPATLASLFAASESGEFPSVWYEFTLDHSCVGEPVYITFDYEFLRGSDGLLAVSVNNETKFEAVEEWTTGLSNAGWVLVGDSSAESYVLRFELFSGESPASELQLTRFMTSDDPPVSVLIQSFTACAEKEGVELNWVIMLDEEIQGFNIYRNIEGRKIIERINDILIPVNTKNYIDTDVSGGSVYEYVLGVVKSDGSETISPLVTVKTTAHELLLFQNHPNPFNPLTTISFTLPKRDKANLSIYNIEGKLITTLINKVIDEGYQEVTWDGTDSHGNPVSSGIYFYRLVAGDFVQPRKMVLLR